MQVIYIISRLFILRSSLSTSAPTCAGHNVWELDEGARPPVLRASWTAKVAPNLARTPFLSEHWAHMVANASCRPKWANSTVTSEALSARAQKLGLKLKATTRLPGVLIAWTLMKHVELAPSARIFIRFHMFSSIRLLSRQQIARTRAPCSQEHLARTALRGNNYEPPRANRRITGKGPRQK